MCTGGKRQATLINKFYIHLVKSFHEKGLGVTILNSDLILITILWNPQKVSGPVEGSEGASGTSLADPGLVLKCFYNLGG